MNVPRNSRTLLGKQPARILLVDINGFLHDSAIIDGVAEAMDNFFSVACNIGGPSRMPLFGIVTFSAYPEILLPLSHVKSNYARIQSAVKDLQSSLNGRNMASETEGTVTRAIEEACKQFKRQMLQNSIQIRGVLQQVEIILLTTRPPRKSQQEIEDALENSDLTNLKRVQLVIVDSWSPDLEDSQSSTISCNSPASGLVDVLHVDGDSQSLHNFFKDWLLDFNTDSEHLHLILPGESLSESENITIRCDLQERILNPAQLPYYEQFTVHSESTSMKTFPTPSKATGMCIPIHRIVTTDVIPIQNICESLVFGVPLILQATSCWKLEWEELEKNQQHFKALCYILMEKEMALVGQVKSPDPCISEHRKMNKNPQTLEEKPCGWYVFLPAPNGTLLVKGIAAKELLLPYKVTSTMDDISDDALEDMRASFEKLPVLEDFNPLNRPSGLYECLKTKYGRQEDKHTKHKSRLDDDISISPSKQTCPGATLRIDNTGRRTSGAKGNANRKLSPLPVKVGHLKSLIEFPHEL
ncbi:meiosis 1 arrest protein-like [Saccostrea echinata]|uniref:meiosis 1 arrest protein-like n=1 Tax=Saccostrea echinata TaxID=191078 RepID=UPI002A80B2C0|nr:meiosis 1 arrest protein-like [Saccostrea echinata]